MKRLKSDGEETFAASFVRQMCEARGGRTMSGAERRRASGGGGEGRGGRKRGQANQRAGA